jgi:hypothetical protein
MGLLLVLGGGPAVGICGGWLRGRGKKESGPGVEMLGDVECEVGVKFLLGKGEVTHLDIGVAVLFSAGI